MSPFMYHSLIGLNMLTLLVLGFMIFLMFLFERSIASRTYHGPSSDHFDGVRFFSTGTGVAATVHPKQRRSVWVWLFTRSRGEWKKRAVVPAIPPGRVHEGILVTYINHATVLLQFSGINILTDPVWSYRASPFSFMGPIRYAEPGVKFVDLPPIDIVLISHNHYDHMDIATLRTLNKKYAPKIFTGLGNAAYLERKGIAGAKDMDWWDEMLCNSIGVVCVPARHFSSRSLSDRNYTLWCGFILKTAYGNLYFAGDTGFGSFVDDIAARFAPVTLSLLPIGAYDPAWMMQPVHTNPDEALRMHDILHSAHSVGIHHGTFRLTDEPQDEPRQKIAGSRGARDFNELANGATVHIKD